VDFTVQEEVFYTCHYTTVHQIREQLKSRNVGPLVPVVLRDRLERLISRDTVVKFFQQISSRASGVCSDDIACLKTQAVGYLPPGHEEFLSHLDSLINNINEAKSLKCQETNLTRQIQLQNNSIDTVVNNQKRLRDNLEALTEHGNSTLVKRYLDDMNRDEDTLNTARHTVLGLTEQKEGIQDQLGALEKGIGKTASGLISDCAEIYC
jgi:hypothetical protein